MWRTNTLIGSLSSAAPPPGSLWARTRLPRVSGGHDEMLVEWIGVGLDLGPCFLVSRKMTFDVLSDFFAVKETSMTAPNDMAIRRALETAGVEFID
jgi:hypothetical protein